MQKPRMNEKDGIMSKSTQVLDTLYKYRIPFLESLLESNDQDKVYFKNIINELNKDNIEYCIIGSIAKMAYTTTREPTKDIDILVPYDNTSISKIKAIVIKNGKIEQNIPKLQIITKADGGEITIDFLPVQTEIDPEASIMADYNDYQCFDISIKIAKPEYLVWLWLESPHDKHSEDIKDIIRHNKVNIPKVISYLNHDQRNDLITKLNKIIKSI